MRAAAGSLAAAWFKFKHITLPLDLVCPRESLLRVARQETQSSGPKALVLRELGAEERFGKVDQDWNLLFLLFFFFLRISSTRLCLRVFFSMVIAQCRVRVEQVLVKGT